MTVSASPPVRLADTPQCWAFLLRSLYGWPPCLEPWSLAIGREFYRMAVEDRGRRFPPAN